MELNKMSDPNADDKSLHGHKSKICMIESLLQLPFISSAPVSKIGLVESS